ncbi:MAG: hypothetical protein ACRCWI_08545 [Brevinema sp.]
MITITLQRNDQKGSSDTISYTKDTITLNEQDFVFAQGKEIEFISPHDQIINPQRNPEGVLFATVIKQYIESDKIQIEQCDKDGCYSACSIEENNSPKRRSINKPIQAEIKVEEVKEKTVSELLTEKESLVQVLRNQYIDADLDDDESLKVSLKKDIQLIKEEIKVLKSGLEL